MSQRPSYINEDKRPAQLLTYTRFPIVRMDALLLLMQIAMQFGYMTLFVTALPGAAAFTLVGPTGLQSGPIMHVGGCIGANGKQISRLALSLSPSLSLSLSLSPSPSLCG